jgi:hypothetical protein
MVFNLTKNIYKYWKQLFLLSMACFFMQQYVFLIVGFIYVINWKILKINIPKEMKTKLVVQSTLVALIENMVFVPWFANK